MIRPYLLFILALVPFLSKAQDPAVVYHFNCSEAIRPAEKFVRSEVASFDPKAIVSIDGSHLKVKVGPAVDPLQIETVLNSLQRGTYTLDRSGHTNVNTFQHAVQPFPQYQDTGNPEADEAAFAQAKQAWRIANPEAHQALLNALRAQQPVPYE